jgi:hypothetical protein
LVVEAEVEVFVEVEDEVFVAVGVGVDFVPGVAAGFASGLGVWIFGAADLVAVLDGMVMGRLLLARGTRAAEFRMHFSRGAAKTQVIPGT